MKKSIKARLEAIQGKTLKAGAFVGSLAVVGGANAAIDTTAVTGSIEAQSGNVELIAAAVLGVLAVIAGVTYLRRVIR